MRRKGSCTGDTRCASTLGGGTMIRFVACCVLWVGLGVANSFAMSDPESLNDLRAGAPVSVREPQPDGFIPRNPGPAVPSEQNADLLTVVREANEDLYSSLQ